MAARSFVRGLCASVLMAGAVVVASGLASAGGAPITSGHSPRSLAHADAAPAAATPAPPCPTGDTCVTIPGTSKAGLKGGTVQAGPTTDLGPNQWVYLNGYGFQPGTVLKIQYCSDTKPLPTPPVCLTSASPSMANAPVSIETLTTGTFAVSFQVEQDPTPKNPLEGTEPGKDVPGTFLCDATTACSIDVVDFGTGTKSQVPTPQNTAVIPVSFAPPTTGCGGSAQLVTTESDYGMDLVVPVAARDSCSTSDPAIAIDTAKDGVGALTALNTGLVDVAFTDDPEASDQQAVLKLGNYKLIPVALTANVVAFRADHDSKLGTKSPFPLSNIKLTATMAAGLLTGAFSIPFNDDRVTCPKSGCPTPPCTETDPTCSLFTQLNFEKNFLAPQQYEPFVRSDTAGSNGLFFAWVCNAPKLPVHITITVPTLRHHKTVKFTAIYTETKTPSQELEYGFGSKDQPVTKCPATEQYPVQPTDPNGGYQTFNDPDQQDLHMVTYAKLTNDYAAFGTMNWAEARYYGLEVAALQNADGQFVTPTNASLDAAVAGATVNADGTLSPDYTKAETGVYPMASVEYAAVCADKSTTTKATAIKDMLTQLLDVTGGPDSGQLPEGFAPLPTTLLQEAKSDITHDVVGGRKTTIAGTTTCPLTTPGTTSKTTPSKTTKSKTTTSKTTKTKTTKSKTTKTKTTTSAAGGSTSTTGGGSSTSSVAQTAVPASGASASTTSGSGTTRPSSSRLTVSPSTSSTPASSTPPSTSPASTTAPPGNTGHRASRTSNLPVFLVALASLGSRMLLPLGAVLALVGLLFGGLLVFSSPFRRHLAAAVRGAGKAAWSFATASSRSGTAKGRSRRTGPRPW